MDAAHVLREVRQRAGLSLRELAEVAGTSHATLSAYETGRKTPRVDTLTRICRAAGYAIDASLTPRPAGAERLSVGRDLAQLLALADAYPFEREGPLDAPVFARTSDPA